MRDEGAPCGSPGIRRRALSSGATPGVDASSWIRSNVKAAGHDPRRFIWIHAHLEPDFELHLAAARRGIWVEYDGIGSTDDEYFVDAIVRCTDAGYLGQLLLSQDRGWFDPALPDGGTPQPFTYLVERFLPRLTEAGFDAATVCQLTRDNPFAAYAR